MGVKGIDGDIYFDDSNRLRTYNATISLFLRSMKLFTLNTLNNASISLPRAFLFGSCDNDVII
jgi:hypothetical protein